MKMLGWVLVVVGIWDIEERLFSGTSTLPGIPHDNDVYMTAKTAKHTTTYLVITNKSFISVGVV